MTEKANEEMNFGFVSNNCSFAISQIQRGDLENRKMGFNILINVTPASDAFDRLFTCDVFTKVIQCFSEENIPIIGEICAAFRNLSQLNPEEADKYCSEIPVEFLLGLKNNTEIIDFFTTIISNALDVSTAFIEEVIANEGFQARIHEWLESNNEDIVKSTLDLFNAIAMFNPSALDFSVVTPFTDAQFSSDIRALALNCILQTSPSDEALEALIGLLNEEKVGQSVFEVIHDLYQSGAAPFEQVIPLIINKCIENYNINAACTLLSEVCEHMEGEQIGAVLTTFFGLEMPTPEQCFALYKISMTHEGIFTDESQWVAFGHYYAKASELPAMELLEFLMEQNQEYCISEDAQNNYTAVLQKDIEHALRAFEFALGHLATSPVTDDLMKAINDFNSLHEGAFTFDENIDKKLKVFMENHQ
jgi:hypothetical protein